MLGHPTFFSTPIDYLKGVGPQKADILKKELQIFTYGQLLRHFPFRYIDKSKFHNIAQVIDETNYYQIKGKVTAMQLVGKSKAKRLVCDFTDGKNYTELVFFQNAQRIAQNMKIGMEYIIYSKPNFFNGILSFVHPDMELSIEDNTKPTLIFTPVYYTTDKLRQRYLDSKGIAKLTKQVINLLKQEYIEEFLPSYILEQKTIMPRFEAIKAIHFPENMEQAERAKHRWKLEELFWIQLHLGLSRTKRNKVLQGFIFEKIDNYFTDFYNNYIPFTLTNAQKKVMKEIRRDVLSGKQMNRLLQGDVGSGKTIVAVMTCLMAIDNGFQAAVMAPTEILAQQHFESFTSLLSSLNVKVKLLTGSHNLSQKKQLLMLLLDGEIDILIGTHALIEKNVVFKNLGIAIIDEQHRFGVAQRMQLWGKNNTPPHILVMTATPIPRTLAMTLWGDLDNSIIDELPPGRKPIITFHYYENKRIALFQFLKKEIQVGRQVYIVYPMIDESEKSDMKDLNEGYEAIIRDFPKDLYTVSVVHGRMKQRDKDFEMKRFKEGITQILLSTTVIEVGVNIPNASIMVIENAERFGLSQLHQLRGRVGRGAEQSYCILMTKYELGADARDRMQIMCQSNDGFVIAEADLRLRGPGNMQGKEQSGVNFLKIADLKTDGQIIIEARQIAQYILGKDADLSMPEHQQLKLKLEKKIKNNNWARIS